ncbi:transcriptional regulator [Actinomadura sp. NTSP31]|uniref:transcriptional regulator n=1 Tax=Actinomadura sp. NTSP31 TaxID=1735447 RepID=UPI0035C08863
MSAHHRRARTGPGRQAVRERAPKTCRPSVRDSLGLSDSVVSKHASALETAGYVEIRKGYVGNRPRTWFELTRQGRRAFDEYVATLQQIVGRPLADTPAENDR